MGTVDPLTKAIFQMARNKANRICREEFDLCDFSRNAVRKAMIDVEFGDLDDAVNRLANVPPADLDTVCAAFVATVEAACAEWHRPCPYTAPELQG